MPSLDLRPGHLDIVLRPGNTHTLLLTWDEALAGRSFTAETGATALDVDVNTVDDTITVTISDVVSATLERTAVWTLTETTDGEQVVIAGRLQPSNSGSASQSSTVAVTTQTAAVTVTPISSAVVSIDGGTPSSTYGGTP